MANSANPLIKKILIGIAVAALILPNLAFAARTSIDWFNPSGTTYIQPNFPSGMDLLIYGTSRYINFNTVTGSSGYGIRDNSGAIEFKNSGGAWTGIGSGGGGSDPFTHPTSWNALTSATSTLVGFTGGLYATASSTIGNGSQTGGLTISGGATTTLGSTGMFNVFATTTANPVFQVMSSSASSTNPEVDTGLSIQGTAASVSTNNITSGITTLTVMSPSAAENLLIQPKGGGDLVLNAGGTARIQVAGTNKFSIAAASIISAFSNSNAAATIRYDWRFSSDAALTAGTNAIEFETNSQNVTRTHATGSGVALQQDIFFNGSTHAFNGFNASNVFIKMANVSINYPNPGNNAKATNVDALLIPTIGVFDASTTNTYGIEVNAATGATNNYAAIFNGGHVGVGSTSPFATLSIVSTDAALISIATTTKKNLFRVDSVGSEISGGDTPTVSCTPSGGTVAGDNTQGAITTGTLSTACTATFADGGFPSGGTMSCQVSDNSTSISFDVSALSNTSVTFSSASALTGTLYYRCGESLNQ